jgi:hypothetical protein
MSRYAIEQSDVDMSRYGKVHAHGCRDLRDPEPFETDYIDYESVQEAAASATGWDAEDFTLSPCAVNLSN